MNLLEVGGANVFGFVGDSVAPSGGASFGVAFDGFAIGHGDLQFSVGEKVGDIVGVRMHWRDLPGLEVNRKDADMVVFEDDGMRVSGDFDDVLR